MGIMRWQTDCIDDKKSTAKENKNEEFERLAAEEEGMLRALMQFVIDMLHLALMGEGSAALLKRVE